MKLRTIDLFAGIGGIRLGFAAFGCENVFTSELDRDAQAMYQANFGEQPWGDITQINPADIPDHDILLAGFPLLILEGHCFLILKKSSKLSSPTLFC
jgi:DNA (cytosine-5)-methyltransferase 1